MFPLISTLPSDNGPENSASNPKPSSTFDEGNAWSLVAGQHLDEHDTKQEQRLRLMSLASDATSALSQTTN